MADELDIGALGRAAAAEALLGVPLDLDSQAIADDLLPASASDGLFPRGGRRRHRASHGRRISSEAAKGPLRPDLPAKVYALRLYNRDIRADLQINSRLSRLSPVQQFWLDCLDQGYVAVRRNARSWRRREAVATMCLPQNGREASHTRARGTSTRRSFTRPRTPNHQHPAGRPTTERAGPWRLQGVRIAAPRSEISDSHPLK